MFLRALPLWPLVFTANLIISFREGVKRCIVLLLCDRTCEHEQARAFFERKENFKRKEKVARVMCEKISSLLWIFTSAGSLPVYEARNHFDAGSK